MNNRLMLESYFNRINNENVQKELLKFGISSYDRQGNKIDSLKLLDSIMLILDELSDNEQEIEFYYLVTLIVGSYYANRFIDTFFYEKLWQEEFNMENYNSFLKTAIKRKGLSKPTKILKDKGLLQGSILNYGCGHNEDGIILSSEGFDIAAYDKFNEIYKNEEVLNKRYDVVVCNYVLNVIPSLEEHRQVLELLKKLGDKVFVSVRSDVKAIRDTWIYNEEQLGYWTTNKSFQRFYTTDMIKELFGEVEYISNNGSFKLFLIN